MGMNFNRREVSLLLELVNKKIDDLGKKIFLGEDVVFDLTERGDDTDEAYQRIRALEDEMDEYCRIAEKLDSIIVGSWKRE